MIFFQVYRCKGGALNEDKAKDFFFSENTVKAAKELVVLKHQQNQMLENVTLDKVNTAVFCFVCT